MKIIIASDIHGSAHYCRKLLDAYRAEGAQMLLLLGDVLYHGPRNDLPEEYAPKTLIPMLNAMKNEIICVRGNCDTEVDQMVLEFPILADYAVIPLENGGLAYLTHGHRYHEQTPPPFTAKDVLLHGHTHVAGITACVGGQPCLNPGSLSIPKMDTPPCYILLEGKRFSMRRLCDGCEYAALEI